MVLGGIKSFLCKALTTSFVLVVMCCATYAQTAKPVAQKQPAKTASTAPTVKTPAKPAQKTTTTAKAATKPAAKTPAKKPVAKAATTAKKAAAPTSLKLPEPPPTAGIQNILTPDKNKIALPDKSKLAPTAKTFTETMKEINDKKAPKKKKIKLRKQIMDARVVAWGKSAEGAESAALNAVRKLVGNKAKFLIKDCIFYTDTSSRVICAMRVNFSDQIPENWYLESEMTTGFGKDYERAYSAALIKAIGKAKSIRRNSDWGSSKTSAELGVIPYDCTFSSIGKSKYCKLFFRYFLPR